MGLVVSYHYIGSELELFAGATNWKRYFASVLLPVVGGRVLEVGAGVGSNIPYILSAAVSEWTSIEPDRDLAGEITRRISAHELPANCRALVGTIESLPAAEIFDSVLYIDVLEHIEHDREELAKAAARLAPGGYLIVLAPAHQFLFSPFDAALGHYRRYSAASLTSLAPPGCRLHLCLELDCAGFFASLANRMLLSSSHPSARQIAFWDRVLVPISRVLDRVIGHRFGKTIAAVWRRDG